MADSTTNLEIMRSAISNRTNETLIKDNYNSVLSNTAQITTYNNLFVTQNIIIGQGSTYTVISGEKSDSATVNEGGTLAVNFGGIASYTIVNSGGNITLNSGGVANNTIVNNGAILQVLSGGITSNTQINSGGIGNIATGASAVSTVINSFGSQQVFGVTGNTVIYNGGLQSIGPQGSAVATVVYSGGTMSTWGRDSPVGPYEAFSYDTIISNGGLEVVDNYASSYNAKIYGSQVVTNRATASNAIIYSGGSQVVIVEGGSQETVISSGGNLIVSGGYAHDTIVSNGGTLIASAGGRTSNTQISSGGLEIIITSGTSAVGTIINFLGSQTVGGVADNTIINENGTQLVSYGAIANNTIISGVGALQKVYATAVTNNTIVNYGGTQYIYNFVGLSTVANSTTINNGGMVINEKGITSGTIINSGGLMSTYGGETVGPIEAYSYDTIINAGGIEILDSYGESYNAKIYDGSQVISNRGGASNATIYSGGSQMVGVQGSIDNTVISSGGSVIVSEGYADGTIINNGGSLIVSAGGITSNTQINSGGLEYVNSVASAAGTVINAFGSQTVFKGTADNTIVNENGTQSVTYNAIANNTIISGAGAVQDVSLVAVTNNTIVNSGGTQFLRGFHLAQVVANNTIINNGGIVLNDRNVTSGTIINSGGVMSIYAGGESPIGPDIAYSYDTTINAGGIEVVCGESESINAKVYGSQKLIGGIASNTIIYSGGSQLAWGRIVSTVISSGGSVIISGGSATGIMVSNGGNLIVSSGAKIIGEITLEDGGSATLYAGVQNDFVYPVGSINLAGNTNGGLTISGLTTGGTIATVISGFNGVDRGNSDLIKLADINQKDVTKVAYTDASGNANGDYVTLTLTNNRTITLNIVGAEAAGYVLGTASDGSLSYEVCFLAGSMIKTPTGEMRIEDICIGDQVMTVDYENNQEIMSDVCWVGNKKTEVKPWLPDDEAGYPVRVVKDAIADGIPYQDLLITAEHCLFFEGKFIPVRMLVNGSSIHYDHSYTDYTYYHIETEKHSVIIANGMLTETYLNTGNRHNFSQDGSFVLFSNPSEAKTWEKDASYPLMIKREVVEPIYYQIRKRAAAIGCEFIQQDKPLTDDPKLHLITASGQEIYPFSYVDGKYLFNISAGIEEVYISSRISRLCDTIGPFIDNRHHLGVYIGDVFMMAAGKVDKIISHLSNAELSGWHDIEITPCRWTKGYAVLPLNHKVSFNRVLALHVLSSISYFLTDEETIDIDDLRFA